MNTNQITVNATTTVLNMDKHPQPVVLAPERTGKIQEAHSFPELKDLFYKGKYQRPIITYVDGMAIQSIPEAFDRTIIQVWKLFITDQLKKDLYWTVMNQKFTRLIVKEPSMDLIIMKGDIKTLNTVYDTHKKLLLDDANQAITDENMYKIDVMYTEKVLAMLKIRKSFIYTAKYEQKMTDALRKYGREYGIDLPKRTNYGDDYAQFKHELKPEKQGSTTNQYMALSYYEDPATQKTFIDNQKSIVLPRAAAKLNLRTEELVALHEAFITLMYYINADKAGFGITKDSESDPFIVESRLETEKLQYEEALLKYQWFCYSNNIPFDPKDMVFDGTAEETEVGPVQTPGLQELLGLPIVYKN